jgi:hypothetical protein
VPDDEVEYWEREFGMRHDEEEEEPMVSVDDEPVGEVEVEDWSYPYPALSLFLANR